MEKGKRYECCHHKGYFGLLFFLVGTYFLAQELGYVDTNFPFWPTTFVIIGLGAFLKHLFYKCSKKGK